MNPTEPKHRARTARGQRALNRRFVTDHDIYQRESELIFDQCWLFACHVSELRRQGGMLAVELDRHAALVVQDEDNAIRAFRNVCRHRGCRLVDRPKGLDDSPALDGSTTRVVGHRIQCPYHAWSYRRDGTLASAPNMRDVEGFQPEQFGLFELPVYVWQGLVFVRCAPTDGAGDRAPSESGARFFSPLDSLVAHWCIESLTLTRRLRYDVAANWKLLFENYNECYHCPAVHPALNRLTPYTASDNDLEEGPILGGPMELAEGVHTMSSDGGAVGTVIPSLTSAQRRRVYYYTIFPSMFLSLHPDYVMLHRLRRVAVDRTQIDCQFLFHDTGIHDVGIEDEAERDRCERAIKFWDLTNRQDWAVCEQVQAGMTDPGYEPGPYANLESVVAAFDRYYLDIMRVE